jgi:hypothetical protein
MKKALALCLLLAPMVLQAQDEKPYTFESSMDPATFSTWDVIEAHANPPMIGAFVQNPTGGKPRVAFLVLLDVGAGAMAIIEYGYVDSDGTYRHFRFDPDKKCYACAPDGGSVNTDFIADRLKALEKSLQHKNA